jgi:hypothetical protein
LQSSNCSTSQMMNSSGNSSSLHTSSRPLNNRCKQSAHFQQLLLGNPAPCLRHLTQVFACSSRAILFVISPSLISFQQLKHEQTIRSSVQVNTLSRTTAFVQQQLANSLCSVGPHSAAKESEFACAEYRCAGAAAACRPCYAAAACRRC